MTWLIKTTGLVPLLLAILTVFGLRTTLLGNSDWYLISWEVWLFRLARLCGLWGRVKEVRNSL